MRRRTAFRPLVSDRLEERIVLSPGTTGRQAIVGTLAVAPKGGRLKVGTLGDSFTDEYRFYKDGRSTARNWVEILAATRRVDFGPLSRASRGEPRNQGFANNWARSDATSDDMVRNQLPGLATQVREGRVDTAWIFIGGNDYLAYLRGLQADPLALINSPGTVIAGLQQVESRLDDNLTTAVRTVLSADAEAEVVLVTLPDVRRIPAVSSVAGLPGVGPLLDAVSGSIGRINARVQALAASEPGRAAVADLNASFLDLERQASPTGKVRVGKAIIDVRTTGNEYRHLFLGDGVHIGTVAQGYLANLFVQAVDSSFGARVKPLKPAEIIRVARMPRLA